MIRIILLLGLLHGMVIGLDDPHKPLADALSKTDGRIHDVIAVMSTYTGKAQKIPDPYDTTSVEEDVDGNGEPDLLIEDPEARGVTGNRGFFLFCSIHDRFRLVGEFGNIFKTIRYEKTGNAYLIDSGHAGGGEYALELHLLRDGAIVWKRRRVLHVGGDEGERSTSPDGRLFTRLRDFTYAEEDLLKLFNEPPVPSDPKK